jgi:hypothetical protein
VVCFGDYIVETSINIAHGMWFVLVVTLLKHQLTFLMVCGLLWWFDVSTM